MAVAFAEQRTAEGPVRTQALNKIYENIGALGNEPKSVNSRAMIEGRLAQADAKFNDPKAVNDVVLSAYAVSRVTKSFTNVYDFLDASFQAPSGKDAELAGHAISSIVEKAFNNAPVPLSPEMDPRLFARNEATAAARNAAAAAKELFNTREGIEALGTGSLARVRAAIENKMENMRPSTPFISVVR